ncbi:hypothetical protein FGB62_139g06 [Gracilaria domingensis]|nr:hypothetical protein FGB62_139g06 [Gracilaria domingensis]
MLEACAAGTAHAAGGARRPASREAVAYHSARRKLVLSTMAAMALFAMDCALVVVVADAWDAACFAPLMLAHTDVSGGDMRLFMPGARETRAGVRAARRGLVRVAEVDAAAAHVRARVLT